MFDYARKMKLALSDHARRIGIKAVAGVVVLVGAGFLLAALWTWMAQTLGWGSMLASLVIGAIFVILGLLVLVGTGRARHHPPTTEDLRAEIEERLSLATEVVLDRVTDRAEHAFDRVKETAGGALDAAQNRASQFADLAGNRVQSLVDSVSYKANRMAEGADAAAHTMAHRAEQVAEKAGLTPERKEKISEEFERAKSSNLAALVPVLGAFAVGITLASRLQGWRRGEQDAEFDDEGPEDDDWSDWDEDIS